MIFDRDIRLTVNDIYLLLTLLDPFVIVQKFDATFFCINYIVIFLYYSPT